MSDFPIYIISSDAYSDIWPIFFDMFYKYWPDFKGQIILSTEIKTYQHPKLKISCTQIGIKKKWGEIFRTSLDKLDSDFVLITMADCIFMGEVDRWRLKKYFSFFIENDLDSFCLMHHSYDNMIKTNDEDINLVLPPNEHMFTFQTAFWKKSMLYQMVLPHENPWTSEWYGSKRANKIKIKLACPSSYETNPILYDAHGCLVKGQWIQNAIDFLNSINYQVNFNTRGFYYETPLTIKKRIIAKHMFVKDGLLGSYWDLYKRRENINI